MPILKPSDLRYSEVTPKSTYLNRRKFLESAGMAAVGALAGRKLLELARPQQSALAGTKFSGVVKSPFSTNEAQTRYEDVTHYNNYYEFGVAKDAPAKNAGSLRTSPWSVSVEGEVKKKQKLDIASLMKLAPLEERIYRHRCVEAWSIVVPWIGFPLSALLKQAEPAAKAKYVAFQSLYDPRQMPEGRWAGIDFPYV
jgi:sulfoxide reductase catalytic subunit YedY